MFQLLVALLAIALTALATLAAVYYGGSAFSSGGVQASASGLQNGGSQIAGAVALYSNNNSGALPANVADLTPQYLSNTPVLPSTLSAATWSITTASAAASGSGLTVGSGSFNVVTLSAPLPAALCAAVNQAAIGSTGSATSGGNTLFGCDSANQYYYAL